MTLRFVPRFKAQIGIVSNAQKGVGRDVTSGNFLQRAGHGMRILSIMVTWALENAIETADSMKSRGYGLPGRTAFSIYRFDKRDKFAIISISLCAGYIIGGSLSGGLYYRYLPAIKGVGLQPYSLSLYICYLALCIAPVIINIMEDRKWKAIQSGI
jgi:energy-coupling factor transport system permease protein